MRLSERGWLELNMRTGLFLLLLAALNEIVRLGFSTDIWVTFKVFAIIPLDMVFALAQIPLIRRHRVS
jgi:intracellular septation protein